MSSANFIVLGTRHVPDTNNTEITVGTDNIERITVTIPDSLAGSAMVEEVIRRAIEVRSESIESLKPVDE